MSGFRLIILLCILFVIVAIFTWSEDLLEPLHAANDGSRQWKEPNVGDRTWKDADAPAEPQKERIEEELNLISQPTNNMYGHLMERFKKRKGGPAAHHDNSKSTKQHKHHKSSSLRQTDSSSEGFTLPIFDNTDDAIPMAADGAVVHAIDALLCRDSVLNYVINATDLKDECDGLIKAYTQTCDADESSQPVVRQRERLLAIETNPIIHWQRTLSDWSDYFQSRFEASMTTHRFLIEDEIDDAEEESLAEREQSWGFSIKNFVGIEDIFGDRNDVADNENNEDIESSDDCDTDDDVTDDDVAERMSLWSPKNSTVKSHRVARRKVKAEEADSEQTVKQETGVTETSPSPDKKGKKPLANLALPVKSKHVSENMLTETLMLQQDNKLMKAVVNQTNITVTEAQEDAAVSSKAVAEAADMVKNILNDPTSVEARTCCTSILNVFHENCSVNEEELSDRRLFVGVGVIALCGLIKSLIRHFHIRWLPEAAGCILVGGTYEIRLSLSIHAILLFSHSNFLI